jgi:hypothetical protein
MRIEFAGLGGPIPGLALPDPNVSDDRPTQLIKFVDGDIFLKESWITLGYTHYEVWCVGGAGGQGGGVAVENLLYPDSEFRWDQHRFAEVAPTDIWNYYLESLMMFDLDLSPPKDFYNDYYTTIYIPGNPNYLDPIGNPGADYGWPFTHYESVLYYNPEKKLQRTVWEEPFLTALPSAIGGAGGGGGVQVMSGELEALPEACEVSVGAAGVNADTGQTQVNGSITPMPEELLPYPDVNMSTPPNYSTWDSRWIRHQQLANLSAPWGNSYPEPHPSFLPPQPGGDGGASSFGDDICQASGGKGGRPSVAWSGANLMLDGAGGAGGTGGQITAGGGASGTTVAGPGKDGTWNGTIGQGGGGGRGGTWKRSAGQQQSSPWVNYVLGMTPLQFINRLNFYATNGGRGSFSFADTSVHGARQYPQAFVSEERVYDSQIGEYTDEIRLVPTPYQVVPGGGGGVRAMGKLSYGSRAPGYDPSGLAVIRLIKLD